jgi:hypothetical protein
MNHGLGKNAELFKKANTKDSWLVWKWDIRIVSKQLWIILIFSTIFVWVLLYYINH